MRSPSLIYALSNDQQRAALNRVDAARHAARETAGAERRERRAARRRPRLDWPFRYRPAARTEQGSAPCHS